MIVIIFGFARGSLAQSVEQRTFNPLVGGSSPPRPTKRIDDPGSAARRPFCFWALCSGRCKRIFRTGRAVCLVHRLAVLDRQADSTPPAQSRPVVAVQYRLALNRVQPFGQRRDLVCRRRTTLPRALRPVPMRALFVRSQHPVKARLAGQVPALVGQVRDDARRRFVGKARLIGHAQQLGALGLAQGACAGLGRSASGRRSPLRRPSPARQRCSVRASSPTISQALCNRTPARRAASIAWASFRRSSSPIIRPRPC